VFLRVFVIGPREVMVVLAAITLAITVAAQEPARRTVWDKIYTDDQARRGEALYAKTCAACHGEALIGGNAPPLKGEEFAFLWSDKSVGELLDRMKTLMPPESPNSLSADAYRDLIAFVMKANNFPAGDKEISTDPEELNRIFITNSKQ
jgi:mono/diheme cytochrome c family protein